MFTPQWDSKGKAVITSGVSSNNLRGLNAELDEERKGGRKGRGKGPE